MSRKIKPSVHKPFFDEEAILHFASMGARPGDSALQAEAPEPARSSLHLQLKTEVINLLREEAARKGKTVDQIVAKLVNKHLGR